MPQASASFACTRAAEFDGSLTALTAELRRRALHYTRDGAAADDLVQDTIERALRFRSSYELGSNLRAWLHQVMFSVFVTGCRRGRRERAALARLAADPCAWTAPEALPRADAKTFGVGTRRELEALPEVFRSVVALVDLGEHSYREAADQLGVPLGTVMSRLHRGRKLLASRLDDDATEQQAA